MLLLIENIRSSIELNVGVNDVCDERTNVWVDVSENVYYIDKSWLTVINKQYWNQAYDI